MLLMSSEKPLPLKSSLKLYDSSQSETALSCFLSVLALPATTWCDKQFPSIFCPSNPSGFAIQSSGIVGQQPLCHHGLLFEWSGLFGNTFPKSPPFLHTDSCRLRYAVRSRIRRTAISILCLSFGRKSSGRRFYSRSNAKSAKPRR